MVARIERCEISGPNDGWFSLYATVIGDTAVECRELAEKIKSNVAQGKHRLFRADVWAEEYANFEMSRPSAGGGVRFAFRDEAGVDEAREAVETGGVRYLPLASLRS